MTELEKEYIEFMEELEVIEAMKEADNNEPIWDNVRDIWKWY